MNILPLTSQRPDILAKANTLWYGGELCLPANEHQDWTLSMEDEQPLSEIINWILIFPRELIKDLSINDPIPQLMILRDLSLVISPDY